MDDDSLFGGAGRNMDRPQILPARSQLEETEMLRTRACANCVHHKTKCTWPASGVTNIQEMGCMKCIRMDLDCYMPTPTPRPRKLRSKPTPVPRVKRKTNEAGPLAPESPGIHMPLPDDDQLEQQPQHVQPPTGPSDTPPPFQLFQNYCFSREKVLFYLDIYRREFMPNYPFVIIPDDADPHIFHSESPCLFWIIMTAVTPQPTATQQSVGNWFRQYIADRLVVKQEKSLSLLQAILVYLAWGDFHFDTNTAATDLVQLAAALVLDLKLDRSPIYTNLYLESLLGEAWATMNKGLPKPGAHTPDEKRAVLGLYHVASSIPGNRFRWNSYLAQCCESLAGGRLESDLYLVSLIKMQRVADRACCILPGLDVENEPDVHQSRLDTVINKFRRELEVLTTSQPKCVKNKTIFWAHYHSLLMRLSEPAISMYPASSSGPDVLPTEPGQRFKTVWKCLQAGVDFFNTFLSIADNELPGLPVFVTGLLASAIVTSSRLLLLEASDDWQPTMARKKLDFADKLKRLSDRFNDAESWAKDAGRRRRLLDGGGIHFCKFSFKLRWIRQWYLSRVPQEEASLAEPQPSGELP